jgi:hypothetical protein
VWGSESKHHNDNTCSKEVGLHLQIWIATLFSISRNQQTCTRLPSLNQVKPRFRKCFIKDLLTQHEFCCVNLIGRSWRTWKCNTHIPYTLFCGRANRGSLNEGLWWGGRIWPIDSIGRSSEAAGSEGGRAVWDRESVAAVAWLWRDTVALLRRRQQARSVLSLMAPCCKYLLPTDCNCG